MLGSIQKLNPNATSAHLTCEINTMNTTKPINSADPEAFESTYALIVRSEEKQRNVSETAIYLLLILSAVFSIWRTADQPVTVPTNLLIHSTSLPHEAEKIRA